MQEPVPVTLREQDVIAFQPHTADACPDRPVTVATAVDVEAGESKRPPARTMADYANARFYYRIARGKQYEGTIASLFHQVEKLEQVDELVRDAFREAVPSMKVARAWLTEATLRKLALAPDRLTVFAIVLEAKRGVTLRDRRHVTLSTFDRARVDHASGARLYALDTAKITRPLLVDGAGRPFEAAA